MNQRSFLAMLVSACATEPTATPTSDAAVTVSFLDPVDQEQAFDLERTSLLDALARGEPRTVLVLVADVTPSWFSAASDPIERVAAMVPPSQVLLRARHVRVVGLRLHDPSELVAIEALREVVRVEPERFLEAASPSLALIEQPAALARGADGRGLAVAVIDTGVDFTHPDVGGCTAAGMNCPVAFTRDFAPDDGSRDEARRHGTNVAAIVRSVAPAVRILALDVFQGTTASSLHVTAALDWTLAERATYGIVAANLSLGYGAFTSPCASEVLAVVLQRVRDGGVVPVVATGNSGYLNAIASPACAPAAVSVGAVDTSNVVASFSNSSTFTTLLAPGVAVGGGGVVMSGTSQAAPHVAGATAALRTAHADDSVSDAIARLVGTGVMTTDARNGLRLPRLNVDAATAGGTVPPPPDREPPTGSLRLGSPYTRTATVAYTIEASDPSGVATMCITATSTTCTAFVPFAAVGTLDVSSGDGLKTVRLWLRDGAGNTSTSAITTTVVRDARAPTTGAVHVVPGIRRLTLEVGTSTDTGSGIGGYRVTFGTGTVAPASCSVGTPLPESASPTIVHDGLVNGTTYRYRVCAVDRAGNVSAGVVAMGRPVAEIDPPTGTLVVDAGAEYARSTRVSVALTATDPSGVTHVCLSATATCSAWQAFRSPLSFTLPAGSGIRTVSARFRDTWGNESAPVSDTIFLDATAPDEVRSVAVARRDRMLELTWPAVTDTTGGSGLADYLVAYREGTTAPTSCVGGAVVASGGAPNALLGSLSNGRTYAFRVCARDVAGNVTRGVTGSGIPAGELDPPTGRIVVASDAAHTTSRTVQVAITASDASGLATMCLSSTTSCSQWVAFAATTTFTLASRQGLQTVYAWVTDAHGNVSTPLSDTIALDNVPPTNPPVRATARSGAVDLAVSASSDTGVGVDRYVIVSAPGTRAPSSCAAATIERNTAPFVLPLVGATHLGWRVCAIDRLGNRSTGTAGVTTPLP